MIRIGNEQSKGARELQEDYFAIPEVPGGTLVVVADGMGGYAGGNIASSSAVKTFVRVFKEQFNPENIPACLENALYKANNQIRQLKAEKSELQQMGTTMVAAFFNEEQVFWISAGDSPFYRWRNGKLARLNANHSFAAEVDRNAAMGLISENEARNHPQRHVVTSGLAGEEIHLVDKSTVGLEVRTGDRFILASDGIHTLPDMEIRDVIAASDDPQSVARELLQKVSAANLPDQDNCTIVAINPPEAAPRNKLAIAGVLLFVIVSILGYYIISGPGTSTTNNQQLLPAAVADSSDSLQQISDSLVTDSLQTDTLQTDSLVTDSSASDTTRP